MNKRPVFKEVKRHNKSFPAKFVLAIVASLGIFTKPIIENILRKDFGKRYFSVTKSLIAYVLLIFGDYWFQYIYWNFKSKSSSDTWYIDTHISWQIFASIFFLFSLYRFLEIRRNYRKKPHQYTWSNGESVLGKFLNDKGIHLSDRFINTYLDNGFFLLVGALMWFGFELRLGIFFMVIAFFSFCHEVLLYWLGEEYVDDKLDDEILNQEKMEVFGGDQTPTLKPVEEPNQKSNSDIKPPSKMRDPNAESL